ncbi:MAG: HAMP domain-containing protein [Richelia sp.]|nr:HAMP domain-containing protein [Richelia sp.]
MVDHKNGADNSITSDLHPNSQNYINNKIVKTHKAISLRTKATIFAIAISSLPILGIGFLVNKFLARADKEEKTQLQLANTKSFANQINQWMLKRHALIVMMANLPILKNEKTTTSVNRSKQAILDKFIDIYKEYDSIAVFDLDGDVIVQSTGDSLTNNSERSYFQIVKETERSYITQPMVSEISGLDSIYLAAPLKDTESDETIAIIRARMPVKSLEGVINNYTSTDSSRNYHLVDNSGKIFLSNKYEYIGKKLGDQYRVLATLRENQVNQTFVEKPNNFQGELVSSVPLPTLPELSKLQWKAVITTSKVNTFTPHKKLLLTIAVGAALTGLVAGAIAAWLAKRVITPLTEANDALTKIGQGNFDTRLPSLGTDEFGALGEKINHMAEQLQLLLTETQLKSETEESLADVTLLGRKSLKKSDVFVTSVEQIRYLLNADRVIICEFESDSWKGQVIAESLAEDYFPMMGEQLDNYELQKFYTQDTESNGVIVLNHIQEKQNTLHIGNYLETWEKYTPQSALIAPIMVKKQVTGLMIVHHCQAPHDWKTEEISLFQHLMTQIGYALEQAMVLTELEQAKAKEQQQKEELQNQLLELLKDIEGAASGDLRVRAEITAGEIGIVADFFNSIIESLRLIVTQVKETAVQVNNSLLTNEVATQQLAESAFAQTTEINRVLDAVDQMTDSIQALAFNTQEAATVANHGALTTQDSGEAMEMTVRSILLLRETVGDTTKKVKRLGESSQQITRVVSLINEMAMQTHLLAINGGIEAARAGEEGEGFAVVAEEVGILATRSSAATKEIEQIVENIQRETSDLVQAMELGVTQVVECTHIVKNAKEKLHQIFDMSRKIDSLVQAVSTATTSQVETVQTVSQLMRRIATISQESSESSRQVCTSLQQTVQISQQLQATVGSFEVD